MLSVFPVAYGFASLCPAFNIATTTLVHLVVLKGPPKLYLSDPVAPEVSQILRACGRHSSPYPISGPDAEHRMRAFLMTQADGYYLLNSFAGPSPATGGRRVHKQNTLGFVKITATGMNEFFNFTGSPSVSALQIMSTRFKFNQNNPCGSSDPSWDPVMAKVTAGTVIFPTTISATAGDLVCKGEEEVNNITMPVVCATHSCTTGMCHAHRKQRLYWGGRDPDLLQTHSTSAALAPPQTNHAVRSTS